jgi:hypothetical protein
MHSVTGLRPSGNDSRLAGGAKGTEEIAAETDRFIKCLLAAISSVPLLCEEFAVALGLSTT